MIFSNNRKSFKELLVATVDHSYITKRQKNEWSYKALKSYKMLNAWLLVRVLQRHRPNSTSAQREKEIRYKELARTIMEPRESKSAVWPGGP